MNIDIYSKLIISRPLYLQDDDCGYCHHDKSISEAISVPSWAGKLKESSTTPSSISIGFQVENMTVEQYDLLINKGFRRSGTFLYKPDMLRGCCRMYTIRTNYEMFKLTKEHKQTVNKFNKRIGVVKSDGFDLKRELNKMNDEMKVEFQECKFTREKYKLFVKYQNSIHNDYKTSEGSFKRFLCDSPFPENGEIKDGCVVKYGAIHQCYYYKGKLIAIGFLDILPSGVSSIYFIYDPDFKDLTMGKISGLKEMILCDELGLDYYYLGYYIQDCPKMNYKRKFGGEFLNLWDFRYYKIDELDKYKELCILDNNENVVEKLYGVDGIEFTKANRYSHIFGVDYSNNNNDLLIDSTPYDIPTVIPGVVPLYKLQLGINTMIFHMGIIREIDYESESVQIKKIILDTLRLIGDELINQSIIKC